VQRGRPALDDVIERTSAPIGPKNGFTWEANGILDVDAPSARVPTALF